MQYFGNRNSIYILIIMNRENANNLHYCITKLECLLIKNLIK